MLRTVGPTTSRGARPTGGRQARPAVCYCCSMPLPRHTAVAAANLAPARHECACRHATKDAANVYAVLCVLALEDNLKCWCWYKQNNNMILKSCSLSCRPSYHIIIDANRGQLATCKPILALHCSTFDHFSLKSVA